MAEFDNLNESIKYNFDRIVGINQLIEKLKNSKLNAAGQELLSKIEQTMDRIPYNKDLLRGWTQKDTDSRTPDQLRALLDEYVDAAVSKVVSILGENNIDIMNDADISAFQAKSKYKDYFNLLADLAELKRQLEGQQLTKEGQRVYDAIMEMPQRVINWSREDTKNNTDDQLEEIIMELLGEGKNIVEISNNILSELDKNNVNILNGVDKADLSGLKEKVKDIVQEEVEPQQEVITQSTLGLTQEEIEVLKQLPEELNKVTSDDEILRQPSVIKALEIFKRFIPNFDSIDLNNINKEKIVEMLRDVSTAINANTSAPVVNNPSSVATSSGINPSSTSTSQKKPDTVFEILKRFREIVSDSKTTEEEKQKAYGTALASLNKLTEQSIRAKTFSEDKIDQTRNFVLKIIERVNNSSLEIPISEGKTRKLTLDDFATDESCIKILALADLDDSINQEEFENLFSQASIVRQIGDESTLREMIADDEKSKELAIQLEIEKEKVDNSGKLSNILKDHVDSLEDLKDSESVDELDEKLEQEQNPPRVKGRFGTWIGKTGLAIKSGLIKAEVFAKHIPGFIVNDINNSIEAIDEIKNLAKKTTIYQIFEPNIPIIAMLKKGKIPTEYQLEGINRLLAAFNKEFEATPTTKLTSSSTTASSTQTPTNSTAGTNSNPVGESNSSSSVTSSASAPINDPKDFSPADTATDTSVITETEEEQLRKAEEAEQARKAAEEAEQARKAAEEAKQARIKEATDKLSSAEEQAKQAKSIEEAFKKEIEIKRQEAIEKAQKDVESKKLDIFELSDSNNFVSQEGKQYPTCKPIVIRDVPKGTYTQVGKVYISLDKKKKAKAISVYVNKNDPSDYVYDTSMVSEVSLKNTEKQQEDIAKRIDAAQKGFTISSSKTDDIPFQYHIDNNGNLTFLSSDLITDFEAGQIKRKAVEPTEDMYLTEGEINKYKEVVENVRKADEAVESARKELESLDLSASTEEVIAEVVSEVISDNTSTAEEVIVEENENVNTDSERENTDLAEVNTENTAVEDEVAANIPTCIQADTQVFNKVKEVATVPLGPSGTKGKGLVIRIYQDKENENQFTYGQPEEVSKREFKNIKKGYEKAEKQDGKIAVKTEKKGIDVPFYFAVNEDGYAINDNGKVDFTYTGLMVKDTSKQISEQDNSTNNIEENSEKDEIKDVVAESTVTKQENNVKESVSESVAEKPVTNNVAEETKPEAESAEAITNSDSQNTNNTGPKQTTEEKPITTEEVIADAQDLTNTGPVDNVAKPVDETVVETEKPKNQPLTYLEIKDPTALQAKIDDMLKMQSGETSKYAEGLIFANSTLNTISQFDAIDNICKYGYFNKASTEQEKEEVAKKRLEFIANMLKDESLTTEESIQKQLVDNNDDLEFGEPDIFGLTQKILVMSKEERKAVLDWREKLPEERKNLREESLRILDDQHKEKIREVESILLESSTIEEYLDKLSKADPVIRQEGVIKYSTKHSSVAAFYTDKILKEKGSDITFSELALECQKAGMPIEFVSQIPLLKRSEATKPEKTFSEEIEDPKLKELRKKIAGKFEDDRALIIETKEKFYDETETARVEEEILKLQSGSIEDQKKALELSKELNDRKRERQDLLTSEFDKMPGYTASQARKIFEESTTAEQYFTLMMQARPDVFILGTGDKKGIFTPEEFYIQKAYVSSNYVYSDFIKELQRQGFSEEYIKQTLEREDFSQDKFSNSVKAKIKDGGFEVVKRAKEAWDRTKSFVSPGVISERRKARRDQQELKQIEEIEAKLRNGQKITDKEYKLMETKYGLGGEESSLTAEQKKLFKEERTKREQAEKDRVKSKLDKRKEHFEEIGRLVSEPEKDETDDIIYKVLDGAGAPISREAATVPKYSDEQIEDARIDEIILGLYKSHFSETDIKDRNELNKAIGSMLWDPIYKAIDKNKIRQGDIYARIFEIAKMSDTEIKDLETRNSSIASHKTSKELEQERAKLESNNAVSEETRAERTESGLSGFKSRLQNLRRKNDSNQTKTDEVPSNSNDEAIKDLVEEINTTLDAAAGVGVETKDNVLKEIKDKYGIDLTTASDAQLEELKSEILSKEGVSETYDKYSKAIEGIQSERLNEQAQEIFNTPVSETESIFLDELDKLDAELSGEIKEQKFVKDIISDMAVDCFWIDIKRQLGNDSSISSKMKTLIDSAVSGKTVSEKDLESILLDIYTEGNKNIGLSEEESKTKAQQFVDEVLGQKTTNIRGNVRAVLSQLMVSPYREYDNSFSNAVRRENITIESLEEYVDKIRSELRTQLNNEPMMTSKSNADSFIMKEIVVNGQTSKASIDLGGIIVYLDDPVSRNILSVEVKESPDKVHTESNFGKIDLNKIVDEVRESRTSSSGGAGPKKDDSNIMGN